MPGDQAAQDPPGLRHRTGARRVAFEAAAVLFLISILELQLTMLVRALVTIRQPIADVLGRPVAAPTFRSELVRDAGQEDAHRRQPLLAVDHADGLHHTRRHGLREGEERTTVVRSIRAGGRDRQEILNQPVDVRLSPAVPTLPARYDVLEFSVEELKELDVLGLHGATMGTVVAARARYSPMLVPGSKRVRRSVPRVG